MEATRKSKRIRGVPAKTPPTLTKKRVKEKEKEKNPMPSSHNEVPTPESPLRDSNGTISSTSESDEDSVEQKPVTDLTSIDPSVPSSPAKKNISSDTSIVAMYIDDETFSRIFEKTTMVQMKFQSKTKQ